MSNPLLGLHHAAVNVSDWDRSIAFYRDDLGCEFLLEGEAAGEEIEASTGLSHVRMRFAMLRAGTGIFELIRYESPAGRDTDRAVNDTGSTHIAFRVDDIDQAYEHLQGKGIRFNAPPIKIDEGPLKGCAFAYFPDPDGVLLEIFADAQTADVAAGH